MKEKFNINFIHIAEEMGNTNYDSIITQLKLIALIQEFYIKYKVDKDEIIRYFEEAPSNDIDNEAYDEAIGEIGQNINNAHRCKSIWEDYGKSYINYLFSILEKMDKKGVLDKECNILK